MNDFKSLCISLLVLATSLLYFLHRRKSRSPAAQCRLPPSPPSLPIIGHLHLLTDMPHHSFIRLADKLGPIFYLKLGQVPTVVISSPELAELVLKTHDHVFSDRAQLIAAQYLSFGCSDVTFSRYGPYWRQVRKICVHELLSPTRVNSFELVRNEELTRMIHTVSTQSEAETNVSELFFGLSNNILCRVAFGKRFGKQENELERVMSETQELFAGFCIGDFFPEWRWVNSVSGMKKRLMKNLKDLQEVGDDIIKEHVKKKEKKKEEEELGADKEDFVDVLLRVQRQHDLEVPITDDNLKALVLDMFVAGTDTTTATMEWAMTELARHPEAMRKAQSEIRAIAESKGDVDESDLQHFGYLKAVIKESLRLHPSVPLMVPRESMQKCTLQGYEIPERTRVLINAYAIGRDQKSWENPLVFDPERFIEKDIEFRGQDFRYVPFGGGRRGCPGFSFGLVTTEITLARLLYHFDWKLPPGIRAEDVDVTEFFGLSTRKKTPLKLVPSRYMNHKLKK